MFLRMFLCLVREIAEYPLKKNRNTYRKQAQRKAGSIVWPGNLNDSLLFFLLNSSFKAIVLLLISGCAQHPIKVRYPMKRNIRHMPVRRSVASASRLISSGPPAPPTIPVQSMPANEPWLAVAVFKAKMNVRKRPN